MDIIIRDVEEKVGQYKIYNKDGTGGHWYITKESAEEVSSRLEPLVSQDFCGHFCKTCGFWQKRIFHDKHNYKQCTNKDSLLFNRIIYSSDARKFGCTNYSKNSG